MRREEFAVHDDIGAGCAEVGGGSFVGAIAAEELDLDRDRELLIDGHGLWLLPMEHDPVISPCPSRPPLDLFADKAVFDAEAVVAEGLSEGEVPEYGVEVVGPVVVRDAEEPVLDAEGVEVVVSELVMGELGYPAVEVFAVEQGVPRAWLGFVGCQRVRRMWCCVVDGLARREAREHGEGD